jgi:hypothetical protein
LRYAIVLRLNREIAYNVLIALRFCLSERVFQSLKGPTVVTSRTSIKSLLSVAALAALSLLAGCGGGGAVTPSCADTHSCPVVVPPTPPLVINPGALNAYAGVPVVVTISSGVGPFQVFTSDATVLPVTQVVPGAAITLVPANVDADRAVTLTVRDAAGQTATVAVTVKATPLIGAMTITPANASLCGALGLPIGTVAICSGETASASLTLKGANALPIANRQVRFDVIQGPYSFALDREATVFAKTITVTTDQNGQAIVTIRSDAGVPTQVSLIRGTDITSGNRVDASFTILQSTSGTPSFSVSPPSASITGYYVNTCGGGSVSYVIYGGTAPYTVFASSLSGINLEVGDTRGQTVIVPRSGGSFSVVTSSSACAGTARTLLTITDATGRVIAATFDLIAGTVALPVAQDPNELLVTPKTANIVCTKGQVVVFTISGGTSPYIVATNRPNDTTVNGGNVTLTKELATGQEILVSIADAKSKVASATIKCDTPPTPIASLTFAPASVRTTPDGFGFCPMPFQSLVVSGGTGPFVASINVSSAVATVAITGTGVVTVTPSSATSVANGKVITISVVDTATGRNNTATATCGPPPP